MSTVAASPLRAPAWAATGSHPCGRWSAHAEDLAPGVEAVLERWPDSPVTACLVADGLLRPLGRGVYLPASDGLALPERAVAVGCVLGAALRPVHVIAGSSAAWVLLGEDPPRRVHVLTSARPEALAGAWVREATLRRGEVETLGGCPVTAPVRTAVDILRFEEGTEALARVRALVLTGHVAEAEISGRLANSSGLPHVRSARERWAGLLSALVRTGVR